MVVGLKSNSKLTTNHIPVLYSKCTFCRHDTVRQLREYRCNWMYYRACDIHRYTLLLLFASSVVFLCLRVTLAGILKLDSYCINIYDRCNIYMTGVIYI